MINLLSNPINRNCSAAKISKVMSSNLHMYDHIWRHCGKILADVGKEDVYMDSGHDGNIDDAEEELYLEVALEFLLLGLRKTSPWVGVPAKA